MKPGNRSSCIVVFLRKHPVGGSLLRLFLDPATSFTLPRSSSPTTSPTASTSPPALHQCLLPIDARHRRMTPLVSFPPCKAPNWVPLSPSFLPDNTLPHLAASDGWTRSANYRWGKGRGVPCFWIGPVSFGLNEQCLLLISFRINSIHFKSNSNFWI
jgi:hypothetical protein